MLLERIQQNLNKALKNKDEIRVVTLRFLLAEIHNRQIDKKEGFGDEDVLAAIRFQVKQHKESIELYQKGKRDDLVAKEQKELEILNNYLPQQMSSDDLGKIIKEMIKDTNASGPKDFGKVMGAVMGKIKGQAEGNQVADLLKKLL